MGTTVMRAVPVWFVIFYLRTTQFDVNQ